MNKINIRSYLGSLAVILVLMTVCYALTFFVPGGEYARTTDENGYTVLDTEQPFRYVDADYPVWKFLLSPFLVLGAEGGGTIIAVIAFLLIIGGVFEVLNRCDLIRYLLGLLTDSYGDKKYILMAMMILIFMAMGSFVGSFEEVVPIVPIVVGLSVAFGWDAFVGINMSMVAAGCGFAAGIMNPFTVGVAQKLAGLPMFSGMWLRAASFFLIYFLLLSCTFVYAKRHEKADAQNDLNGNGEKFVRDPRLSRAIRSFAVILGIGVLLIISSVFIPALQDLTMIIVALMFLVAGVVSAIAAGVKPGPFFRDFGNGVLSILPAVLMILLASSIKYTLTESKMLDTMMHAAVGAAEKIPRPLVILFIYLLVLVLNFFIASGSAKAFLVIPLIVPIASVFGISAQLCIVAYAFGDGFSNVFYPTNPALLICLGLSDVPYPQYAKRAWKFQLLNLLLTSAILMAGLALGY